MAVASEGEKTRGCLVARGGGRPPAEPARKHAGADASSPGKGTSLTPVQTVGSIVVAASAVMPPVSEPPTLGPSSARAPSAARLRPAQRAPRRQPSPFGRDAPLPGSSFHSSCSPLPRSGLRVDVRGNNPGTGGLLPQPLAELKVVLVL